MTPEQRYRQALEAIRDIRNTKLDAMTDYRDLIVLAITIASMTLEMAEDAATVRS